MSTIRDLPMEVWSRVATFVPFTDLLRTFWALVDARVLPDTRTNASNAFLQFCSGVVDEREQELRREEQVRRVHHISLRLHTLLIEMGFDATRIELAIELCGGREDAIFEYLLHRAASD